ncbi:hypothetical protein HYPSUDRAFT_723763 [Hypholoma sublateritium FD-334 SS-4]|uniref:Uncharacterized protein n=1 Tax=Hypholoma sublateritium (strain FD-334 SS-4) TaxID=945553 RepID=A0A0D2NRV2_HYPSF|nr:hypothetical protein HYPSUDRAFT_723763 [Hypholoma sublateritium FD-334 SS-4]
MRYEVRGTWGPCTTTTTNSYRHRIPPHTHRQLFVVHRPSGDNPPIPVSFLTPPPAPPRSSDNTLLSRHHNSLTASVSYPTSRIFICSAVSLRAPSPVIPGGRSLTVVCHARVCGMARGSASVMNLVTDRQRPLLYKFTDTLYREKCSSCIYLRNLQITVAKLCFQKSYWQLIKHCNSPRN